MIEIGTAIRNWCSHFLYAYIAKPIFFRFDPEVVHDGIIRVGKVLGRCSAFRFTTKILFSYKHKKLEQTILGIKFTNPVGLAAGFDKNGELTDLLPSVGFGFVEVGSVTGEPCAGNAKPRLWRLPKSKGLVVYYGLKNDGCERITKNLKQKKFTIPTGVSIAKTNSPDTVDVSRGIADYTKAFVELKNVGAYATINISCPNAYGGEPFTDPNKLDSLLTSIDEIKITKPIFLKLSADLTFAEVDAILETAKQHRVHGFICTNLTKNRANKTIIDANVSQKGGIGGKPVQDLSTELVRYVYQRAQGNYVVIGCGGIFSAADAYEKIKAGASLVQVITGMIFEGPQLIGEINRGLVKLLKKDGFDTISEAVGSERAVRSRRAKG
ncbi:quinone-dependent dihydroorotate dehydrogenase [Candidatus Uhrbacteria bacterium CG10_big_fil_rev_8_21_14_0_10_48_11]|uniref:Dihydroorotate dehydrogenase (quinone) n=1 Tax=Candidatus Uhrbacteria bacterium CG10_big_fil_rev_8_21_14_0_10_48_11 TaxID=1975037 RepID=A0A2M8LEK6_9BACT|nr:MAG: quinone-dependent dihydroorotate dehydrogenase [Candidatus Uhrbacteria bacterium CG10_big_fil_rev_8_21_14_0_10_48_11]